MDSCLSPKPFQKVLRSLQYSNIRGSLVNDDSPLKFGVSIATSLWDFDKGTIHETHGGASMCVIPSSILHGSLSFKGIRYR